MRYRAIIGRDLRLAYRRRGELATPVIFFVIVTALFPLALNPDPALLRTLAPGVIWVAALLAVLIGQDRLFKTDYEDGSLELMLLSPISLEWIVLLRVFTHWLVTGLPLVILSLLLAMMLDYPMHAIGILVMSLLLGTPILSFLGAIGASLTVGLRRGFMLLPILVLPLTIPVLIFGAAAAGRAALGDHSAAPLYFLGAMLMLTVTLSPFAIAGGLRVSLES
ncbi:MAG: heme exporter protein CcmB [Gammaproteobacteria bacterium]|nr:heme exporter protein CcmB [Gammaproteobacteria bacterium]